MTSTPTKKTTSVSSGASGKPKVNEAKSKAELKVKSKTKQQDDDETNSADCTVCGTALCAHEIEEGVEMCATCHEKATRDPFFVPP